MDKGPWCGDLVRAYGRVKRSIMAAKDKIQALLAVIAEDAKNNPTRDYIFGLAFPLAAYGVGMAMMMASLDLFWIGFYIAVASCLFIAAVWWILSGHESLHKRVIGSIIPAILLIPILWLALRPAPLDVAFIFNSEHYDQGTNVNGISWQSPYSETTMVVSNKTEMAFNNVTMWIRTDRLVAKVSLDGDPAAECRVKYGSPFIDVMSPARSITDSHGNILSTTPVNENDVISTYTRVHCPSIASQSELRIYVATVEERFLYHPPTWATASITYEAGNRRFSPFVSQCKAPENCVAMPKSLMSDQYFKIEYGPPPYLFQIRGANP
jgi:hypothetical protein